MSADSFNNSSTKVVTLLIAGTIDGQYQWSEVSDEKHVQQCRNEIGPSAKLEGKVYSIKIKDKFLRVFKYRNYIPLMTRDSSYIKTQDGSVFLVAEGRLNYVLEIYDTSDYSSQIRLNPSNSISDLYDTIAKNVFSVDDLLKNLEEDKETEDK